MTLETTTACVRAVALDGARSQANASSMTELIQRLVKQANLNEDQAKKVAEVVRGFLSEKLPEPLRGPVEGALTGTNVSSALDQAKGLMGKLF